MKAKFLSTFAALALAAVAFSSCSDDDYKPDTQDKGSPYYTITTPVFDEVTIHLDPKYYPQGDITITTTHGKGTGRYIQSMSLGGKPLHSYRISHAQLIGGRHLTMQVGDRK